ncbi:hypothetical protein NL676_016961 [Syzygium grande]|nr:hypothetical protein NL676_016961 [Syzygium grande]
MEFATFEPINLIAHAMSFVVVEPRAGFCITLIRRRLDVSLDSHESRVHANVCFLRGLDVFVFLSGCDERLVLNLVFSAVMGVEEDLEDLNALAESTDAAVDRQALASAVDGVTLQPTLPSLPPAIPPPAVPPVAPVPAVPPVLRPLAPLPIRPAVFRPQASFTQERRGWKACRLCSWSTAEYEITEESRLVRKRHEKAMQDLMMKWHGAGLAVPTNDKAVHAHLCRLGELMTLFGEREMERRDRLRMLMAKLDAEGQLEKLMTAHKDEEAAASAAPEDVEEEMLQYPFYTERSKALLDARIDIAKFLIARAALHLERARRRRDGPDEDVDAEIDWALKKAESLSLHRSEIGDDQPLSGCSFSHDGKLLATW